MRTGQRRAGPARRSDRGLERETWSIAVVVVLGTLGSIFATTSVYVAFSDLGVALDADLDTVQWVASGYLLGLAAVIATTGWLTRRFGARRVYLVTLAAFAFTSALCAAATTIEQLIVLRFLQGIAGGATLPVGQIMLATAAGPDRMGRVMSVIGVPMLMGPAIGPVVGGLLVEIHWQWVFLMNVPLAVAGLILGIRLLPHAPRSPAGPFDVRGFVLMVLGAPLLVYGLARVSGGAPLADPGTLIPIGAGVTLIAVFALHAQRADSPLLDLRLWANRSFATSAITGLLVSASLFGSLLLLPLYFLMVRGEPPSETGLMLSAHGVGTAISMLFAGRLTERYGGGRVGVAGIAILASATVPLTFIDDRTPYALLYLVLFVRGLGAGGSVMPVMAAAYHTLREDQIPDSSPQLNVVQRIGSSLGIALLAVVLADRLAAAGGAAASEAAAFGATFWWAVALALFALLPAAALWRAEAHGSVRRRPRDEATAVNPEIESLSV